MNKIMFNERYGLQKAVFGGRKTQTRLEPFNSDKEVDLIVSPFDGHLYAYEHCSGEYVHISRYAVGEILAVAQRYSEIADEMKDAICVEELGKFYVKPFIDTKGWKNKMFVKADLMPHHIRITDIRCERLHDISDEDCVREGIEPYYPYGKNDPVLIYRIFADEPTHNKTKIDACYRKEPQIVFSYLINKLNGKKFWDSNPYVIVYEFEKID